MSIESDRDLQGLTRVGRLVAATIRRTRLAVEPGVTTAELDEIAARCFAAAGATAAPSETYGFPGSICICVDDEAVHGIPGPRRLRAGQLVTLDVAATLDGYVADAAVTVAVPPAERLSLDLALCAEAALARGIAAARGGVDINRIGRSVEREARRRGFRVLRELTGHGVGRALHEPPTVRNYDEPRARGRLRPGLVLTIEPIVTAGRDALVQRGDGWTVATADGALAAHAEHTVVITRGRPLVLTAAA